MASCTYSVPDKSASGDNYYAPLLNDDMRTYFWNAYGFHGNKDYWDDGWGWDDDANTDKALARTFNGCWALTYSAIDYQNDSYTGTIILNWARRYVRNKMDDLQAHCGDNPYALATTKTGAFVDDRTELYLGFFYNISAVERAAILLHETRHYDVSHDADFPPWSVLATAGQGQQADSSWDYSGAYHYEVAWLSWYVSVGVPATPAQRDLALLRANWCLDNAFAAEPGFRIDANAEPQGGWRYCRKCNALAFAGFGELGRCAAGGPHDHTGSWNFTLIHGSYGSGQNGWLYCNKCHMLAFSHSSSLGTCPAGGVHEHGGSWDFAMLPGTDHPGTQRGWRWCDKCQGIAFQPFGAGLCPAGGGHHYPSGDYTLPALSDDVYPKGQEGWRWCSKCQGLAFAPNGPGHCPAGGGHDHTGSWDLVLFVDAPSRGETNWRWCNKCQGLAFGGATGPCPAGGSHNHKGSGNYTLAHDEANIGQKNWRRCFKCQGLNYAGYNAGHCPGGGGHTHNSWDYGLTYFPS